MDRLILIIKSSQLSNSGEELILKSPVLNCTEALILY